jgi:HD superfamily phosphohydrolase YqeK
MPDAGSDNFNPIRCWQHSLAVAELCQFLAGKKSPDMAALAYLVGLCHDLADIFMNTQFAAEYQQVVEASIQTGQPIGELMGQMLGMTPAQIANDVFKIMALPEHICAPIQAFHTLCGMESSDELTRILWMAENFANAALLASSSSARIAPITQAFCRDATGLANLPVRDPQSFRAEILALTVALAKLPRKDEARLMAPMFATQEQVNLWIARDESISYFDPIEVAFKSLATTTVKNHLPNPMEAGAIDGLVIVAASPNSSELCTSKIEETSRQAQRKGKTLPILAICSNSQGLDTGSHDVVWRSSIALTELSTFVESLNAAASSLVA